MIAAVTVSVMLLSAAGIYAMMSITVTDRVLGGGPLSGRGRVLLPMVASLMMAEVLVAAVGQPGGAWRSS